MYERRCYVSVAVLDGLIYAIGGFSGYGRLKTVERYDTNTNQWTLMAPMNERRSDASATSQQGKVSTCTHDSTLYSENQYCRKQYLCVFVRFISVVVLLESSVSSQLRALTLKWTSGLSSLPWEAAAVVLVWSLMGIWFMQWVPLIFGSMDILLYIFSICFQFFFFSYFVFIKICINFVIFCIIFYF